MFNSTSAPSLADIAAVTNNNDAIGGNGWWVLIILLALFGGWGNRGYGSDLSGAGAANNYVLASDFATLQRQIDSASSDLKAATTSIGNGLSSLGYDQLSQMNGINTNIANSTNSLLMNANTAQNALTAQINAFQAQFAQCCCENKYLMAEQATQTRQAIADSQAAILARLDAMERNAMQDKIAELTAQNQNLKFQASQMDQSNYIVNQLKASGCCGCNC